MIKIKNKYLISTPVISILERIKFETAIAGDTYLKQIKESSGTALVTCPFHKNHNERTPSCGVFLIPQGDWNEGDYHCFACGEAGTIVDLVARCFQQDQQFGEGWLTERFGNTFIQHEEYLPEIVLDKPTVKKEFLDESVLIPFDFYHPYMWQRKLTKDVVDRFRIGYDKERDAITFPVYDEKHRLVMVTARSVNTKRFYIPRGVDKPVYLLYDIIERGVTTVFVAESQINALTLRSFNYDSVALFGTGSSRQYETLRKSGIRHYILVFDGDEAGRRGALRFKKNMPDDVFITDVRLPAGKDVNDLTKEEFDYYLSLS